MTTGKSAKSQPSRIMSVVLTIISSALILGVSIGIATLMYLSKEPPEARPPDSLIMQVRVQPAVPFTGDLDLTINGSVVPQREVRIATEVSGKVTSRSSSCNAGSFVRKGDLLVEIDRETYELALKTAEAELNQARQMVVETETEIAGNEENVRFAREQYNLLQSEFERNLRLGDVITKNEIDQSRRSVIDAQSQLTTRENALSTSQSRLSRMKSAVELAERRLERAELDLARTTIVAPFNGVIVKSLVEKDDFVSAGTILFQIEDTEQVEVLCNINQSDLRWIRANAPPVIPGQTSDEDEFDSVYSLPKLPVSITDASSDAAEWHGWLDRFDGIGRDELTKATPVRIVVENPVVDSPRGRVALVRGMYVKCRLLINRNEMVVDSSLLAVPSVALKPGNFLWIVRDNKIYRRMVSPISSVSPSSGEPGEFKKTIVRTVAGEVQPGDMVVVTPMSQPSEGALVQLESDYGASPTPMQAVNEDKTVPVLSGDSGQKEATPKGVPVSSNSKDEKVSKDST